MADHEEQRVERELISALFEKRWLEAVAELNESGTSDLAAEARARSEVWQERTIAELDRLARLLADRGVAVLMTQPHGDLSNGGTIDVGPDQAVRAISVLRDLGYVDMYDFGPGQMKAWTAWRRSRTLVSDGRYPATLRIRWGPAQNSGPVGKLLAPAAEDLSVVELPTRLWWGYSLVRPLRLVMRAMGMTNGRAAAGPYLATPAGMVEPILQAAGHDGSRLLIDIGCGDGRVLIEGVLAYGGRGVGVERSPELAELARARVAAAGLDEAIQIIVGAEDEIEMPEPTTVFVFLPSRLAQSVVPGLLGRLRDGSVLVAHEQEDIPWSIAPTSSRLILAENGVTVAHTWVGGTS